MPINNKKGGGGGVEREVLSFDLRGNSDCCRRVQFLDPVLIQFHFTVSVSGVSFGK